jgi:MFS family permease
VDRGALPTAAHLIQDDLKLTPSQLGWLFSAFFWSYTIFQIPVGWLTERFGAHRILAGGLIIWAAATMCIGAAHSFPVILGLRLLLGIGESVGFPAVSKLLAAVVPVRNLGVANGVVAFGYLLGPAAGTFLGGRMEDAVGWRLTFLALGGVSLFWLLPWSRVKLPARAVRRTDADKPHLKTILRQPSLWGTSLGLFSSNYFFYFMLSWIPYYLVRERGFSTAAMTDMATSAFITNAVFAIAAGWVLDKLIVSGRSANNVYKTNMAFTHVGSVVCMVCMAFGSSTAALAAMFAYQALCGMQSPGCYAIPQILAGPRATGRWVGIQNSIGNVAGIITNAVSGLLIEYTHHFTAAFLVAAVMGFLGVFGWVTMLPTLKELPWDEEEKTADSALRHSL